LKGAPPKMSYFESFLPLLRENGATGILLEYEETFPFSGNLAEAKHTHAYTMNEVNYFKKLCKDNNLYIVPLVQTYGHLEWLLKLKKFKHLRDNARYPQVSFHEMNSF
jgi:hexosaminidase